MRAVTGRAATESEITAIGTHRGGGAKEAIDWSPVSDGQWWLVHEGRPNSSAEERRRAFGRIKMGTRRWAARHGYGRELRRRDGGRLIWVRFFRMDAEERTDG